MRQRETKRAPFATRLKNQASFRYFTKTLFTKIKKSTQKNSKKRKKRRLLSLKRPEFQQRIVHAQRHGSTKKKQTKIFKNALVVFFLEIEIKNRKQYSLAKIFPFYTFFSQHPLTILYWTFVLVIYRQSYIFVNSIGNLNAVGKNSETRILLVRVIS